MARAGRAGGLAGWALFAGTLFAVIGGFNVVAGIVSLAEDRHFSAGELFFGDLAMWGIVLLSNGAAMILTSWLIFKRSPMGQVLGILLIGFNLFVHLFFIGVFPIWSLTIMVVDCIVLYGLFVHGEEFDG
jgi:hypothetical protein